ncbi:LamG-like jellyroll fold domain-containing protein [Streptomyces sp. NPDC020141]|uniref:LamG-like jellyroll fold domain-containing protein n=1 Tax=Streptomyces sp. NPDC020141 TaxID=3365065 RepID=UPI00379C18D7
MTADQSVLKIYSDRTYAQTTMVRHQGTALAFALDDRRRIVYTVLDLSAYDEKRGELDAAYWSENPVELPFPDEIVKVGYALVGATAMPVVKRGGRAEAAEGQELLPEETDAFLSSTARLTAPAPFQVTSDGTHVVVLRQAIGAAHADAVFALAGGGSSGDASRTDFVTAAGGAKVPVVADTLLCDRFLLVDGRLKPVSEVRYRRSRHKSEPESSKDSLGATDMDGKPFHEPTQELAFVRNLTEGRFAALLTPTTVQGHQRWQFFAHNGATRRIDSFNVEQGEDGLFNTQGSRYWTSPSADYKGSVFERAPGACPFTGLPLVPVSPENRLAETALQLNGANAYVDLGAAAALKFQGKPYAVEAWVKPQTAGGPVIARWAGSGQGGFQLRITNSGQVVLDHSTGSVTSSQTVPAGTYAHIAASFDGTVATLYVNGAFSASATLAYPTDGNASLRIGSAQSGGFFSGVVDEVRIWNRARSRSELTEERSYRLIGNEPGLIAYYRLDEGSGTAVYDQTDTAALGTVTGAASWVTSEAQVSDHPGVRRDSFGVAGRDVISGLAASLYYQQEQLASGYEDAAKPAKRQARVLLAFATRPTGNATADAHIAALDFGVGADGRLAAVPDVLTLADIDRPTAATSEQATAKSNAVGQLEAQAATVQTEIRNLETEKAGLESEIAAANAAAAHDPTKWSVELRATTGAVYDAETSTCLSSQTATEGQPLALLRNPVAQWQLRPVPGSAPAYGNPTCVLVRVGSDNLVAEPENTTAGAAVKLVRRVLTGTLPASAQWYVRGGWGSDLQLQNAAGGLWLGAGVQGSEQQARRFRVEKIALLPDAALQTKVTRVATITTTLEQRGRDLAAKWAEIRAGREELARLTNGLMGAGDLVLPVPHIGIDASGLSSAGGLLKFARGSSTPFLLDSATGRVVLYFQGANSQFFAAYLDTTAVRGVQQLVGGGLTALFTARDPGVDLSTTQIRVTDSTVNNAAVPGLCDLTLTRGTETETFARLPRRARDLAAAVNGESEEPVQVGTVASVSGDVVTLTQASRLAVPAPSYVRIGTGSHLVNTAAAVGSTTLRVVPAPPGGITAGTPVSLIRYDADRAASSRPGASLAEGSRWITVSADKGDLPVPNGTATPQAPGYGSRWRGDSPGRAFALDGYSHRLSLPADRLDRVTVTGDLTVEAWVNSTTEAVGNAKILQLNRGSTRAGLALNTDTIAGGLVLNGVDVAMAIPGADPTGTDFTIECWLRRTTGRTVYDTIVAVGANGLSVGFTNTGAFRFAFTGQELTTSTTYADGDWHHWAVTFDRATRAQVILRDGVEVARRTATALPSGTGQLIVGRTDSGATVHFSGRLAELRTWSTARSAADILADRNRRVSPKEPGLTGAWSYDGARPQLSQFPDSGPLGRHGGVWGAAAAADSALKGHRVIVGVGDKFRRSREIYPNGEWAHLAVVYEQSWALSFNGSSWAETPDADTLDVPGDLTIEVFAAVDAIGGRQGLVSKGRLGDGSGGSVPYQLAVRPDGKLEFAFEEPGPTVKRFTSTSAITAGFRRIAVVRKAGRSTEEIKGARQITYTDTNGQTQTKNIDVVERVDAKAWDDIRFVVDGVELGTSRYTGPGPRGNDGALEIGRAREGTAIHGLKGAVGEVRIWGRARETNQLGTAIQPRDEGLLARWTFEENEGSTSADAAGGHDLKLHGATWAADPNPAAGSLVVHRNGQAIPCESTALNLLNEWGDEQLTLGSSSRNGNFNEFLGGTLEEVRLWRTARTPEQLLDNLFTRVKGDKQDLLAYWPFDTDSLTTTADIVRDHSLRGNDLAIGTANTQPRIVLSTAPVSADTAAVRSALTGVRTAFHEQISAPPAAAEYADLQYTRGGEAYGVLKRCYSQLANGVWRLTTGYKVGDLISEWVSQVQFDPQLIGYIEGAPPVPSENLTGGTDPTGCSSVTFQQADEVTSTLSSARERSADTAFSVSAGNEVDESLLLIIAPLGIGTAAPAVSASLKGRIGGSFEFSNGWTDETSVSQGTSTARDTSATLTGSWEDPSRPLNSDIGRRFVPANNGYALVQSETADVYALRLAHSGALVAYRMLPNPDIPKDWNIISFPINPQYTKQGTLDGAVGFNAQGKVLDPAYANASQRGEHSYFKPREAYALKRRILRERQQLENYYDSVSTETHDADPTAERAAKVLESVVGGTPGTPEKSAPSESSGSFANRNIANTYVWTADGGFFAETTGTVDVVSETTGGSYSFSGAVTASLEGSFEVAGIGIGFQLDGSVGGGLTVTRQRSKEATRSHSLAVECNPTRDLQRYENGQPKYDTAGKPVRVPGKVDAYRFMTLYLGQDTTHFDDFYNKVADPVWLANSTDSNAAALRQARHSDRRPPCWRVLHRVTYISRILPAVPPPGAPPVEGTLRGVDIQSNYELVRRLDPYIRTATDSTADLAAATRTALAAHLPQLLPHATEIIGFFADYYGIND